MPPPTWGDGFWRCGMWGREVRRQASEARSEPAAGERAEPAGAELAGGHAELAPPPDAPEDIADYEDAR